MYIDMFTACTTPDIKEGIVKSFTQLDRKLKIIIATVTFGMGMNCQNVHKIIHCDGNKPVGCWCCDICTATCFCGLC